MTVTVAERGHRGKGRERMGKGGAHGVEEGKGNSHRKKEVAALQCGALRVRCCGNGGNLLEWGGARESMVPFIIRYCRPEAVNDNDARARRGEEGQAGRDEPRRAWQGQKCTVAVAADAVGVDAGLDSGWTFSGTLDL